MTTRTLGIMLWGLTGLIVIAGGLATASLLSRPYQFAGQQDRPGAAPSATQPDRANRPASPPLARYRVIWQRPIDGRLDQAAATTQPAASSARGGNHQPPTIDLELIATAVETERAYAIFLDPQQKIRIKRIGDEADGATIKRIDGRSVLLSIGGRTFRLRVPDRYRG